MSSIEERPNAATDTTSYRVRFRHDGKNRAVTFVSRDAAQSWQGVLDTLGSEKALKLIESEQPTSLMTVADQVDHHIKHLTGVEPGTRIRYQRLADTHLRPTFGTILLAHLTRDHVAAWVNGLDAAPKTIQNWHSLLSGALTSAVLRGDIPANPAKSIRLPGRTEAEEMVFLTHDEFATLLTILPEQHRPLATLLTLTGIRWGEATALQPGEMHRATRSARIKQAWKQTSSGAMKLGPPKSARSRRTVAVPDAVFDALEPLVRNKGRADMIFTAPRGGPLRSGAFHNTVWQRAATEMEEQTGKRPRIHDLRHTFASWAIQANIPLPVIQRQMGHEKIGTTSDTYGHLARSDFDPLLYLYVRPDAPSPPQIES